jgi:hypothetical protein
MKLSDKMEGILQGWLSPAGALLLLGGIVWGVQLNVATMNLGSQVSELAAKQDQVGDRLLEISENNLRTSLLITQLAEEVVELKGEVSSHNKEAEIWKRTITRLQERAEGN